MLLLASYNHNDNPPSCACRNPNITSHVSWVTFVSTKARKQNPPKAVECDLGISHDQGPVDNGGSAAGLL